jgi:hypothetical protein
MPMMAMTTSNSTSVNPPVALRCICLPATGRVRNVFKDVILIDVSDQAATKTSRANCGAMNQKLWIRMP